MPDTGPVVTGYSGKGVCAEGCDPWSPSTGLRYPFSNAGKRCTECALESSGYALADKFWSIHLPA